MLFYKNLAKSGQMYYIVRAWRHRTTHAMHDYVCETIRSCMVQRIVPNIKWPYYDI